MSNAIKMTQNNGITVTLRGLLSYPRLTAQEGFDFSQKHGKYPFDSVAKAKASFDLLLDQDQFDIAVDAVTQHVEWAVARHKAKEEKNICSPEDAKDILAGLKKGEFRSKLFITALNQMNETTAQMAGDEYVGLIGVKSKAGSDFKLRAIARTSEDMADPSVVLTKAQIVDLGKTVHEIDAGDQVMVTISLFAYVSSGKPGISASASTIVFSRKDKEFGGGVSVDEDAMFADD